ncbi:hypothetical protein B0H21DRAFT_747286 [Amylocystis lapponica]|nr:hypothetical protein B0H21DRAFT_747286 [Amylocystis lapponica]
MRSERLCCCLKFFVPHGTGIDTDFEYIHPGIPNTYVHAPARDHLPDPPLPPLLGRDSAPASGEDADLKPSTSAMDDTKGPPASETSHGKGKGKKKTRSTFRAPELEELARYAVDMNPWGRKHGEKGKTWACILEKLQARGYFKSARVDTLRNKMEDMLEYQADPESSTGSSIDQELDSSTKITIAALLDKASELKRRAKLQTEDQKAKANKKAEDDRIGGEAICQASMETLHKCRRTDDDKTDTDSDVENRDPRPLKKRRGVGSSQESSKEDIGDKLLVYMEKSDKRREERDREMLEMIKETAKAYERVLTSLPEIFKRIQS